MRKSLRADDDESIDKSLQPPTQDSRLCSGPSSLP
jgi:hypothetical protein